MFHKSFYITLLVITAVVFASLKGNASLPVKVKYKIHAAISKLPKQAGRQADSDLLLNVDDDNDETSSKVKYKLAKITAAVTYKFNTSRQWTSQLNSLGFYSRYTLKKHPHTASYLYKNSISISICCLRI